MSSPRRPLYERLPEVYRIRDSEQTPPGQLAAFLGVIEDAFAALHARTDAQYHDLFIEHCDDWVVAYLADLLGTSRLAGGPWTLRAEVARTVFNSGRYFFTGSLSETCPRSTRIMRPVAVMGLVTEARRNIGADSYWQFLGQLFFES